MAANKKEITLYIFPEPTRDLADILAKRTHLIEGKSKHDHRPRPLLNYKHYMLYTLPILPDVTLVAISLPEEFHLSNTYVLPDLSPVEESQASLHSNNF